MERIVSFFEFIQGLDVSVFMPMVIFGIGLIFGLGFRKSLKAGLTIGVGFVGINLVLNGLLGTTLAPAVQAMVDRFGFGLSTIDVGWPASAAIAMGSQVGIFIIPLGVLVNFVMLLTNTTQTVDVDIWNYWHFAFTGSLIYAITGKLLFGIIGAVINMVIILVLGDVTAKKVQESVGIPGVSLPHGFSAAYAPIAMLFNWIFDHLPGLNKINLNFENLQEKMGILGEPLLLGTLIGVVIGLFSGYDFGGVLLLGISLGAVLILIPKMAALLMEGLEPISEAAAQFIQKRFQSRSQLYIGLDSAIGCGNPMTLTIAYLLMPISILIALALPGNTVLPFGDLAVLPFLFVLVPPLVRNNAFRSLLVGILVLTMGFYIATDMAPVITEVARSVGFEMPAGAAMIASICDGANPLTWILVRLSQLGWGGLGGSGAGAFFLALWNRNRILKESKAIHEAKEESSLESIDVIE